MQRLRGRDDSGQWLKFAFLGRGDVDEKDGEGGKKPRNGISNSDFIALGHGERLQIFDGEVTAGTCTQSADGEAGGSTDCWQRNRFRDDHK